MRVLRCANVSVRVNFRLISVTVLALALVATLIVLQLISGDYPLSIRDVVSVLGGGGSSIERTLVLDVRAGRAFVACVVGAALGFAGALTQSVARNPLASPDTLGITQGAACAVVLAIAGACRRCWPAWAYLSSQLLVRSHLELHCGGWLDRGGIPPFPLCSSGWGVRSCCRL